MEDRDFVICCTGAQAKIDEGQRWTDLLHNRASHYIVKVGNFSALVHSVFLVQSNYIKLNLWFHLPPGTFLPAADTSVQQHPICCNRPK